LIALDDGGLLLYLATSMILISDSLVMFAEMV